MRRLWLIIGLLFAAIPAAAQNSTVTATITSPDGFTWANATGHASILVPGNAQPYINGSPVARTIVIPGINGFGTFTMSLWDNNVVLPAGSMWNFAITDQTGNCSFTTGPILVTGVGPINLSAAISAYSVPLAPCRTGSGGVSTVGAGNLNPLFTTLVTNPTSSPFINFTQISQSPYTFFGNFTGGSATPTFGQLTQTFATVANEVSLPNSRTITAGTNVSLSTATAGQLIINSTGGAITFNAPSAFQVTGSPGSTITLAMPAGWTTGTLLLGTGANTVGNLLIGANTYVLTSNGTTAAWAAPPTLTATCMLVYGADNGPPLATGDLQPQLSQCYEQITGVVTQVILMENAGASTFEVGYRHNGTVTNITPVLTPATVSGITDKVACSNTAGTSITIEGNAVTCNTLSNTILTVGDFIETSGGTADGTTARVSAAITYTSNNGGGGGGGGSVTTLSVGNLSPLFTASVANPTSTPAVTFTLSNAAADTVFANCTGGSTAPSFCSLVEAMLPTTTVFTDTVNTYTGTHLNDFTSAIVKVPNGSGLTLGAAAEIGYDTATNNFLGYTTAQHKIPVVIGTWTNGDCATLSVVSGAYGISDSGLSGCGMGGGGGSVVSVGLQDNTSGGLLNITNSPIITSGNIGFAFTSFAANTVLGNCTIASSVPTACHIIGTMLPNPSATSLGGVQSITVVANNFLTGISTLGVVTQAQPTPANLGAGTLVTAFLVGASGSIAPTSTGTVTANRMTPITASGNLVMGGATSGAFADSGIAAAGIMTASSTNTLTNKTINQEGSGNVITTVFEVYQDAAGCNVNTAAPIFSLVGTSVPTPNCLTGSNTQQGSLDYDDGQNEFGQFKFALPHTWTGNTDILLYWLVTSGGGSNTVAWTIQTACTAAGATFDTPFNAAQTVTTNVAANNITTTSAQTSITVTGCAVDNIMHIEIGRNISGGSFTGTARLIGARVTGRKNGS